MIKIHTLKNGLRVVTEKSLGVNSIGVGIMVQNGSRNESEELNGISHVIEHMMFKGTKTRNAKELAKCIEDQGGQLNAYTSKESTCYYVKNLYTHLDMSLKVLSDMILNSVFSEEELEKEISVIIEEINMNNDSPEDLLYDLHSKAMYGDSSLARPVLGTIDKVKNFSSDIVRKYFEEKYTPLNSVISICGRIDEDEVLELVEKYFGEWKSNNNKLPEYEELELSTDSLYCNKDIEQLHISLGLNGLKIGDEHAYPLALLCNIFGGGASSVLFQKVREEMGLCYNIYCFPQSYVNTGFINIYAGLNKDYALDVIKVIKRELIEFVKTGITEEELAINKEKLKANYILGLESTSAKMFSNAKQLLFRKRIIPEEEVLEKVNNITMDDINFVLKECFGKGIVNAAFIGPNVDEAKLNDVIFENKTAFVKGDRV